MSGKLLDLTGQRFYRLVGIKRGPNDPKSGRSRWYMQCDCGSVVLLATNTFRSTGKGIQKSCGCYRREKAGTFNDVAVRSHLMRHTPEYNSWRAAVERCGNPNNKGFKHYGGRGIGMCAEWTKSFEAFYAHIGPKPPGLTLGRIDNDRGYERGNVRWETRSQQNKNRRPFKRTKDLTLPT
jgi:hypothetical protein